MEPFPTAEAAILHIRSMKRAGGSFELPIADNVTVCGHPDANGTTMVVDAILKQRYIVDGLEQRNGYKILRCTSVG